MARTTREWLLGFATVLAFVVAFEVRAGAQILDVGPGSTYAGDVSRGEGVFLQGAAWYELRSAQARRIDAQTAMMVDAWNQQVYQAFLDERARAVQSKRIRTKEQQAKAEALHVAEEVRLRTAPTAEDVRKGTALNALLVDLANPLIPSEKWRTSAVELPEGLSLKDLVYQFAPKGGARGASALSGAVIALARLDTKGNWPAYVPLDKVGAECHAYEEAYDRVKAECKERKLDKGDIDVLDGAIKALIDKAKALPNDTRGFKTKTIDFIDGLNKSAKLFDADTIDYAQEIIADTMQHKATTVEEVIAFMRKYRLMFAQADESGSDVYHRLFTIMKQQAEALDVEYAPPVVARPLPTDPLLVDSSWQGTRTMTGPVATGQVQNMRVVVESRNAESFTGRITLSSDTSVFYQGPIKGSIQGDLVRFSESESKYPKLNMKFWGRMGGRRIEFEFDGTDIYGKRQTGYGAMTRD